MARNTDATDADDATDAQLTEYDVELLYLTFDEDNPGAETARDLRTFGLKDPDGNTLLDTATLATAYDEHHETTIEAESPEAALDATWAYWNRGSGYESQDFIAAETRSLSAGDIVIVDGQAYFCASIGWTEIELTVQEGDD